MSARISATRKAGERDGDEENLDYDSDQGPPVSPGTKLVASWRLDPDESLSDWTIEIQVHGVNRDTYHVHKHCLAVGPRKSEYFAKLFAQGGRFSEAKDRTSRIELETQAADAFPELLDYMYFPDRALVINTNNATALYSMAKYFDMRCLRWEASNFWKLDIRTHVACGVYYEHARLLNENKILEAAVDSCSSQIMSISKTSRLVHVPDPNFWLRIFKNNETNMSEEFSCHLSILVAEFAQNNIDSLDEEMFSKLTDHNRLPIVDVEAALPLIDAERQIVLAPDIEKLSNLQERCIEALAKKWSLIDTQCQARAMQLFKKQTPFVLSEILGATLSAARSDANQQEQELFGFHRLVPNTYVVQSGGSSFQRDGLPTKVIANAATLGLGNGEFGMIATPRYGGPALPLFYFKRP